MARKKKAKKSSDGYPLPMYEVDGESVVEVEVSRLRYFTEHPYKVRDDEAMKQLKDSIKKNGILTPLIVMPTMEGDYQIVSGHRRKFCAEALGIKKVPVIIRAMSHEDAVISMVDSNLQRPAISYSEKAFAYKMKNDALKRKAGKRRKTMDGKLEHMKGETKKTVEVISDQCGDSPRQVTRYIRLTYLIPELLEKLDDGQISFNPAVDIAFLPEEEQRWVLEAMDFAQAAPSLSQSHRIRDLSRAGILTADMTKEILSEVKRSETADQIAFTKEQLYRYFPKDYSREQIKREILELLKQIYQ